MKSKILCAVVIIGLVVLVNQVVKLKKDNRELEATIPQFQNDIDILKIKRKSIRKIFRKNKSNRRIK